MEKLSLWYCDNVASSPYQMVFLLVALAGAFFYGRDQKKLAWVMVGIFVVSQIAFNALTHLVFVCKLD